MSFDRRSAAISLFEWTEPIRYATHLSFIEQFDYQRPFPRMIANIAFIPPYSLVVMVYGTAIGLFWGRAF